MATNADRARLHLQRLRDLRGGQNPTDASFPPEEAVSPRVANGTRTDAAAIDRRWALLNVSPEVRGELQTPAADGTADVYARNIENFIGTAKVPIGIAGPLRVRGLFANGDYYVPLATTEAALVASYTRGCQAITAAGGCLSAVVNEGVSRSPVFSFADLREAGRFVVWVTESINALKAQAATTTRHGQLVDLRITIEGNNVFLLLDDGTGDAAGQNMVTIATEAVCRHIAANSPVRPRQWFVEGNMSGDKKASSQSFQSVRGKKVIAEVTLPAELVQRRLRAGVRQMVDYYRISAMGGVLSGNIGIQGHYANGLAAVYIACGQDAGCVAESAVGVTRFEQADAGGLYAAVTLPNLIVGTVGGGTKLPSQRACLDILGLAGEGKANALAEVCGALVLAGELSIIAALAAGQFVGAHEKLARGEQA